MRTPEQTRKFLLERSTAIGGSDVHHLLNLPPHGCERRLWYDKKGVPADFPFEGNRHTRRGLAVEPHAIEEFCATEGYEHRPIDWTLAPGVASHGAHIDQLVWKPGEERDCGVLEVKVPSLRNFHAVCAKGPPEAAQMQLQWGIAAAMTRWGIVLVFNADLWRYRHWRFERDEGMIADLQKIGAAFWKRLEAPDNPYPKLAPTSRQCQDCPWRRVCQGISRATPLKTEEDLDEPDEPPEQDESFFDLVAAYVAASRAAGDADKAKEAAGDALKARLGDQPRRLACLAGKVNWYQVSTPEKVVKQPAKSYMVLRVTGAKDLSLEGVDDVETD